MSAGERDFASLALRAAIGPMLIAHGSNKVFGSGGLAGTTRWFEALGLRPAAVHARMAAADGDRRWNAYYARISQSAPKRGGRRPDGDSRRH